MLNSYGVRKDGLGVSYPELRLSPCTGLFTLNTFGVVVIELAFVNKNMLATL
ncbi:MAG: hypothetical protein FWD09_05500 [Lentimicrobiaceae bacterium]|nr:hypothetical protein [Lentimicrobiaceae bacterium]